MAGGYEKLECCKIMGKRGVTCKEERRLTSYVGCRWKLWTVKINFIEINNSDLSTIVVETFLNMVDFC